MALMLLLGPKETATLRAIGRLTFQRGRPPTVTQIARRLRHNRSSALYERIRALRRKRLVALERGPGRLRVLVLTTHGKQVLWALEGDSGGAP